jgi:RHS repeat-associated protein
VNPFRFSTKYQDEETDLVYYGYRYYNAGTGRWFGRDIIGETGGPNLFSFLRNNTLNAIDLLGALHADQELPVEYDGKKIGTITISRYDKVPPTDEFERRGARLFAVPFIDDCSCALFKWRQRKTAVWEKEPPVTQRNFTNVVDVEQDAKEDWYPAPTDYAPIPHDCSYPFQDTSRLWTGYLILNTTKVTVSFELEFVRLDKTAPQGPGKVLITLRWGYWFTKTEHELLNKD